jgi:hypothetical protein
MMCTIPCAEAHPTPWKEVTVMDDGEVDVRGVSINRVSSMKERVSEYGRAWN